MAYFKTNDIKILFSEYRCRTSTGSSYPSITKNTPFGVISAEEARQRLSPTSRQHTPDCSRCCNNETGRHAWHTHTHTERERGETERFLRSCNTHQLPAGCVTPTCPIFNLHPRCSASSLNIPSSHDAEIQAPHHKASLSQLIANGRVFCPTFLFSHLTLLCTSVQHEQSVGGTRLVIFIKINRTLCGNSYLKPKNCKVISHNPFVCLCLPAHIYRRV